jgi:hypothetical protein
LLACFKRQYPTPRGRRNFQKSLTQMFPNFPPEAAPDD